MRSGPIAAKERRATRGKGDPGKSLSAAASCNQITISPASRVYTSTSILLVRSRIRSRCRVVIRTLLAAIHSLTCCFVLLRFVVSHRATSVAMYPDAHTIPLCRSSSLSLSRERDIAEDSEFISQERETFFFHRIIIFFFFLPYRYSFVSDSPISAIDYFLRR